MDFKINLPENITNVLEEAEELINRLNQATGAKPLLVRTTVDLSGKPILEIIYNKYANKDTLGVFNDGKLKRLIKSINPKVDFNTTNSIYYKIAFNFNPYIYQTF